MIIVYQPSYAISLSLRLTPWGRVLLEKLISPTPEIPRIVWNPKVHYHYFIINNQSDAASAVLFLIHCEITLHVSGALCTHHQEYIKL